MAKSSPAQSLLDHTDDVVRAFERLFGKPGSPTRLGLRWAAFFKLTDVDAVLRNGLAAAWTHDWGKANDRFIGALAGVAEQLLHHAPLGALLMHHPAARDWLGRAKGLDQDVVLAAVFGHHLNAASTAFAKAYQNDSGSMRVLTGHADFRTLLTETATALSIDGPLPEWPARWSFQPTDGEFDIDAFGYTLATRLLRVEADLKREQNVDRARLLRAVRAALIAADAAGSGLFRTKQDVEAWFAHAFARPPLDGNAVRREIIDQRVADVVARGRPFEWNEFQLACDRLPDRALLLAPCGSGKTLAAWRWIAAQLDTRPAMRVIFLYPTRGTATEGFRDYVAWAPEEDAALVHGTADFELDGLFENPDDARHGKFAETQARLFALRQWPKRVFSATADQFLAFLQHAYPSTCHLPLLADSVVVVDEVHSFDRGMFSALQDFLKHFDVPVLCMTATLPTERRQALEACGLETYPREMPDGLRQSATYPRYRVRRTTPADAPAIVRAALADNKRVLWVVNQIKRCQSIARDFAAVGPALCYHSRFKLVDRNQRHKAVVNAFRWTGRPRERGVLAVTTQVCEMSLDLDADVVVTESAPATALVQRMGRGCREPLPTNGRTAEVWVVGLPADDNLPYAPEHLDGVDEFIDGVVALGVASQADLDTRLSAMRHAAELKTHCRFVDSGPWAVAGEESFRDTDDYTRPAVLPEDVEDYVALRRGPKSHAADGLVLPVPKHLSRPSTNSSLPAWLAVAHDGHYSPEFGFLEGPPPAEALVI